MCFPSVAASSSRWYAHLCIGQDGRCIELHGYSMHSTLSNSMSIAVVEALVGGKSNILRSPTYEMQNFAFPKKGTGGEKTTTEFQKNGFIVCLDAARFAFLAELIVFERPVA